MNADEKVIGAGQDTERGDRLSQRPLRRAFSCLVAVGVYSVIISLAFVIVTALYATSSSDCKTTVNNAQNIKELVHYDILAVDNSMNGGETLEIPVDEEGKTPTIICNCGEKAVLMVFKVIVLIAIAVFSIYVACRVTGHFCAIFLKSKQASLLKREKAAQQARDKLILELGLQNKAAETGSGASRARPVQGWTLLSLDIKNWLYYNG